MMHIRFTRWVEILWKKGSEGNQGKRMAFGLRTNTGESVFLIGGTQMLWQALDRLHPTHLSPVMPLGCRFRSIFFFLLCHRLPGEFCCGPPDSRMISHGSRTPVEFHLLKYSLLETDGTSE